MHKFTTFASCWLLLLCFGCQPSERDTAKPSAVPEDVSPAKPLKNEGDLLARAEVSLVRGVDWLLAQQADDGGWHSSTYGPFKGGAATTALVLYAASKLPEDLRTKHQDAWLHGWKFLEPGVLEKGFVVCPDGTMDEPVYATALVLIAARNLDLNIDPKLLEAMQDFLWRERCGPERGFAKDDPNYGGWDLAGGAGLGGETPGSNVSITRFAVEALQPDVRDPEFASGILAWAGRVQNVPGDGGFFFHPARDHEGNKAQWADEDSRLQPRSYGTATCDGLLLLAGLNRTVEDGAMQGAIRWLVAHPAVDRVPGFEDTPTELGWQEGLLYYYLMSLAQGLPLLPVEVSTERRPAIIEHIISMQHEDGRWQNESARMREDDPLIATSFALVGLGELER